MELGRALNFLVKLVRNVIGRCRQIDQRGVDFAGAVLDKAQAHENGWHQHCHDNEYQQPGAQAHRIVIPRSNQAFSFPLPNAADVCDQSTGPDRKCPSFVIPGARSGMTKGTPVPNFCCPPAELRGSILTPLSAVRLLLSFMKGHCRENYFPGLIGCVFSGSVVGNRGRSGGAHEQDDQYVFHGHHSCNREQRIDEVGVQEHYQENLYQ